MLKNTENFVTADIRLAEQQLREKQRLLEHWSQDANSKLSKNTDDTKREVDEQGRAINSLGDHWDKVGHAIDKNTEKVRTLSGEVLTLKEYEARQLMGGQSQVNYQNFSQNLASIITGYSPMGKPEYGLKGHEQEGIALAKKGYSFEQIVWILQNPGLPPPPNPGPRIPGFQYGGSGDFGDGTIVMLHGKETIVPEGQDGSGGITMNVTIGNINGTGRQVFEEFERRIMDRLKTTRQYGSR